MKKVIFETLEKKEALVSERLSKIMTVKLSTNATVSNVNIDTNTR